MLSVICVYNNAKTLKNNLLYSLRKQDCKYDLVLIDNRKNRFTSASAALNYGFTLSKPRTKFIFFAHQDIRFSKSDYLSKIENKLNKIKSLGVAGFAGRNELNYNIGDVVHNKSKKVWGRAVDVIQEVQTLDELGAIIPRTVFNHHKFDAKTFNGWHCYVADYCLWSSIKHLKVVVLPFSVEHNTGFSSFNDYLLFDYQEKLLDKYPQFTRICTTNGDITRQTMFIRKKMYWFKKNIIDVRKILTGHS